MPLSRYVGYNFFFTKKNYCKQGSCYNSPLIVFELVQLRDMVTFCSCNIVACGSDNRIFYIVIVTLNNCSRSFRIKYVTCVMRMYTVVM